MATTYKTVLNPAWKDSVSHKSHDFRQLLDQIDQHLATLYNKSGVTSDAVAVVAAKSSSSSSSGGGGGGGTSPTVTFSGDLSGPSYGPQKVIGWESIPLDATTMATPGAGTVPVFDMGSGRWKAGAAAFDNNDWLFNGVNPKSFYINGTLVGSADGTSINGVPGTQIFINGVGMP